MTDSYRAEVLGRHYNERKHQGARTDLNPGQLKENFSLSAGSNATARAIAEKAHVDERTVRNYAAYAAAVEKMKAVNPEAVQRIRAGEIRDAKTRLAPARAHERHDHANVDGMPYPGRDRRGRGDGTQDG